MENTRTIGGWIRISAVVIVAFGAVGFAGVGPAEKVDVYRLVEGTAFDDCVPCLRPTILWPIDGGFKLIPDKPEPWYDVYEVRDFHFRTAGLPEYAGHFKGWYKIGGDFAYENRMRLEGEINGKPCVFEGFGFPQNALPWIEIKLNQIVDPKGPEIGMYALYVVAAPWPGELRFSTNVDFTPGDKTIGKVSNGDLLAASGRVVRRNHELTRRLGIMPVVPDLGLDAVTPVVLSPTAIGASGERIPACEIWFSMEQKMWSESLSRWLHDGDVLSDSGKVVRSYADLIGAFVPMPPTPEVGLDALASDARGQILFSTKRDFFSEKLGKLIGHGDLLNENGTIYKTMGELLAEFQPAPASAESLGLDAVLLLPRDEIWFSTEIGFTDKNLGAISDGDLLSTNGRIVMKNLHLLREFKPLEKLGNFGLDAVEFASRSPLGDYDADCDVQLDDFAELAARWLSADCVECGGIDLTWDGIVDLKDLFIFADHWLMGVSRPQLAYKVGECGSAGWPNPDPQFTVKVQGQYAYFEDLFVANCCAKDIQLEMGVSGNEVTLTEIEIPGAPCDCICGYPIRATLGPLEPGAYTLNLYRRYEYATEFVGTVTFVIGPAIQYSVGSCGGPSSLPPTDPRFSVQVQGRYVQFKDPIWGNCCDDTIELAMEVTNGEITITETEYAEHPCRCMCTWPTTARLGPFEPGTFLLAVVQQDYTGHKELIGTVKVTIE